MLADYFITCSLFLDWFLENYVILKYVHVKIGLPAPVRIEGVLGD